MQNIAKTDINSPGSTSQQERRQKKATKSSEKSLASVFECETKEQRQAKLEVDRGTTAKTTTTDIRAKTMSSSSKKTKKTARNGRGANQEIGLSQEYYQHQFDFELVQDGDRRLLLARHNDLYITKRRNSNIMD